MDDSEVYSFRVVLVFEVPVKHNKFKFKKIVRVNLNNVLDVPLEQVHLII